MESLDSSADNSSARLLAGYQRRIRTHATPPMKAIQAAATHGKASVPSVCENEIVKPINSTIEKKNSRRIESIR